VASLVLPRLAGYERLARVVLADEVDLPGAAARLSELAAGPALDRTPLPGYDERSLSLILYTSGSTGRPKGVMLGAGSFWSCGASFVDRFGLTGDDNYVLPLTLSHAIGALTAQSIVLHTGGQLTLLDRFSPSSFWQSVSANGCTVSILFPAQLNLLLEADDGTQRAGDTTLRLMITHSYLRRFADRFGIELGLVWGMTETGAVCTGTLPDYRGEHGDTYVGRAMKGAAIAAFDGAGVRLPAGEQGEIRLRHPHVMLGYLKDPEATAASLVDGWVCSGDQGIVDAEGGLLYLGRLKNMIKRSGENISSEEVETALLGQDGVSECAALAVPDPLRTEEVAAVVVQSAGVALRPADLRDACAATLARWKLPRYLVIRDESLPRLSNGKIDRVRLSAAFDLAVAWDAERGDG
jgi:crotonobetaine/carnitine-CoA ligase